MVILKHGLKFILTVKSFYIDLKTFIQSY